MSDKTQSKIFFLPPPHKVAENFDHAAMVDSINPDLPRHPTDRIRNGENPYRAMREFREFSAQDVASKIPIEFETYIAVEKGLTTMTKYENLAYCHLMNCWPYELHEEGRPLRPEIRDAMIHVISNAEDYGFKSDGSKTCKKMSAMLKKEASEQSSTDIMRQWINDLSEQSHAELLIKFIRLMLRMDGTYQLRKIDNDFFDIEQDIVDFEMDKLNSRNKDLSELKEQQEKAKKPLDNLGWLLYPKNGHSDRPDWAEVFSRIQRLRSRHYKNHSGKTVKAYHQTPHSIGCERWPAFGSTTVRWKNKEMSWDDARHLHADMLMKYWKLGSTINIHEYETRIIKKELNFLQQFVEMHIPVFIRFMNRQEIMHSMAVRSVMDDKKRLNRYCPPEMKSKDPVMASFVPNHHPF